MASRRALDAEIEVRILDREQCEACWNAGGKVITLAEDPEPTGRTEPVQGRALTPWASFVPLGATFPRLSA